MRMICRRLILMTAAVMILAGYDAALRPAFAQSSVYSDVSLKGSWGVQFSGEILPLPIFKPDWAGPFLRTVRFVFDGRGNLTAHSFDNYAGHTNDDNFSGGYSVSPDGTFTIKVINVRADFLNLEALPFPYKGNNAISFFGVLLDNGKSAFLMVSGIEIEGVDAGPTFGTIGNVISGHATRQ